MKKGKRVMIFSFVTAAMTVAAGILHVQMAPGSLSHDLGQGILFLIGGLLQVFWAVPVIRHWGRVWQVVGIAGTAVFFALWYADRLHLLPEGNLLGGERPSHEPPRGFAQGGHVPRGAGIVIGGLLVPPIEFFQIAFIGLYVALSKMISKT